MLFKLRVAQIGVRETRQRLLAVPTDQQRPVEACVRASQTLFVRHAWRQSALEQVNTADPGS
jgi:hypothetical protein